MNALVEGVWSRNWVSLPHPEHDDSNGVATRVCRPAFGKLDSRFRYAEVDEILDEGVEVFLEEIMLQLGSAGLVLQRTYFLH